MWCTFRHSGARGVLARHPKDSLGEALGGGLLRDTWRFRTASGGIFPGLGAFGDTCQTPNVLRRGLPGW